MTIELVANLILCLLILALGIWAHIEKKYESALYIGIAFGLSHFMKPIGVAAGLTTLLMIVRTSGYLLVIYALYRRQTLKNSRA